MISQLPPKRIRVLVAITALSIAFACAPNNPTSVRDFTTNRNALVRWVPLERTISEAITEIDAPATAELVALFANIARADFGADDVSQFQIRFRDYSDDASGSGLSGILRGYESQSGF